MMKITIDTKEDSHEDIRKVMRILADITSNSSYSNAPPENVDTSSMMNMFDSHGTSSSAKGEGTAPDFSSFLNLTNPQKEKKAEIPKIEFL